MESSKKFIMIGIILAATSLGGLRCFSLEGITIGAPSYSCQKTVSGKQCDIPESTGEWDCVKPNPPDDSVHCKIGVEYYNERSVKSCVECGSDVMINPKTMQSYYKCDDISCWRK